MKTQNHVHKATVAQFLCLTVALLNTKGTLLAAAAIPIISLTPSRMLTTFTPVLL